MADSVSDASQAFDPFSQTVVFRTADGEKIPVPLEELNIFAQYAIQICINYATQIGASAILLALLLVMTPHDKRRSPIFIFNTVSLVINILRNVFQCLYYTGSFWNVYSFVTFDYSIVKSTDVAYSVTATILTLTLLICIQTSLVLQVQVVCVTVSKAFRYALVLLSSIVALATIGVRFALTVVNVQSILGVVTMGEWTFLASSSNIILSCSICFFSLIFTGKLAFAIRNRRKLGMKQFGPMQIIFVMGCNTLIVPGKQKPLLLHDSRLTISSHRLDSGIRLVRLDARLAGPNARGPIPPAFRHLGLGARRAERHRIAGPRRAPPALRQLRIQARSQPVRGVGVDFDGAPQGPHHVAEDGRLGDDAGGSGGWQRDARLRYALHHHQATDDI